MSPRLSAVGRRLSRHNRYPLTPNLSKVTYGIMSAMKTIEPTILLVDDERVVREALAKSLASGGYCVQSARDGKTALKSFSERRPDLVLLDVMMPGMDGYAVCEAMRALDRETPIVFLSALDAEDNQIRGLEVGADDYVAKSASESLLLARIKKALARADRFSKSDAPASLTKVQADIYRVLDSDRGRFFSFGEIFSAICGEGYTLSEGVLRVHIYHLRKRLPAGETIETKRKYGYALVS